jgi:choline dehydrogenase
MKHIAIVGGGTSGAVLAARLSETSDISVTLFETGPDDDVYGSSVLDPIRAPEAWQGASPVAMVGMQGAAGIIPALQGRLMGGTSAVNGMATLRGLPEDYDGWAAAGLDGWGWDDVADTFISAENDLDFGSNPLHGDSGPLTVRRWRRNEMSHAQNAFYDGMVETNGPIVCDINDSSQLPGIGIFPVTIDANSNRLTTSRAYLTPKVRQRENLQIHTKCKVTGIHIDAGRATGIILENGEEIEADDIIISTGALWTPILLMRSGVGPADHLAEHGIKVKADLPVGDTLSDHLGAGIRYIHEGPRGGTAGPAQSLYIGASNGKDVDYHLFPIAPSSKDGPTTFTMGAFLMRSSGNGKIRMGETSGVELVVTAPTIADYDAARLEHAFARLAGWEKSKAAKDLGCRPEVPHDLSTENAVAVALERNTISYGHMAGTCPMGSVLNAECQVLGIDGLRVVDASVMPTIPSGNTYLGCVMIAERVARKIKTATRK